MLLQGVIPECHGINRREGVRKDAMSFPESPNLFPLRQTMPESRLQVPLNGSQLLSYRAQAPGGVSERCKFRSN